MAEMPRQWVRGAGAWDMMLSMGTESMSRSTTGQKTLCPHLREILQSHLAYAPRGLREDGSVVLSSVREVTGHRSKYASGATGKKGHAAEVVEGGLGAAL